jgi:hypothetical protein
MVPAKTLKTVGMSNRRFRRASDYDLYIRIAAKFDVTIIKKRLTRWRYLPTSASGPERLRAFRYLPEDIAILKKHLRDSSRQDRALIRQIIHRRLDEGFEKLYYYGLETDRMFATRAIMKMIAGNPTFLSRAVYLAGLWCPDALRNKLGPAVRRMVFRGRDEIQG